MPKCQMLKCYAHMPNAQMLKCQMLKCSNANVNVNCDQAAAIQEDEEYARIEVLGEYEEMFAAGHPRGYVLIFVHLSFVHLRTK